MIFAQLTWIIKLAFYSVQGSDLCKDDLLEFNLN